jgi:hypothetical protein
LRSARTVSRAITLPPIAAWIGIWNIAEQQPANIAYTRYVLAVNRVA